MSANRGPLIGQVVRSDTTLSKVVYVAVHGKVCMLEPDHYSTISTSPDPPFVSFPFAAFFPLRSRIARLSLSS